MHLGDASPSHPPIVVDTVRGEKGPADGLCSLFMAITALENQADYGGCVHAAGATSISIPAGTFDISGGLVLGPPAGATPSVTFTLVGRGVGSTSLDTDGVASPAIELDGLTVKLSQLTVRATNPANPTTGLRLDGSAVVTLDHTRVTGFTHSGVWNADATLTLLASTIDGNSTSGLGGGLYAAAQDANASPTTFIHYSTISGNSAFSGGGIYNLGYLNLMYSTIAGNMATGGKGGGIYLAQDYLETGHCTIAWNSATETGLGGGIYIDPSVQANVHVNSSIVAHNTGSALAPDYSGMLRDRLTRIYDRDVLGSAAGVTAGKGRVDVVGDPWLDVLRDNGGPTETCALLESSPAIDASRDFSARSTTDQSLACAPYGPAYDVGAYEWRPRPTSLSRQGFNVLATLLCVVVGLAIAVVGIGKYRSR